MEKNALDIVKDLIDSNKINGSEAIILIQALTNNSLTLPYKYSSPSLPNTTPWTTTPIYCQSHQLDKYED